MLFRPFCRRLHITPLIFAAGTPTTTTPPAAQSSLATLRKKTGYTFANCKKALQLHDNDLTKAEQWLREQAQALGWSKATKLEGRVTRQGLVGVLVQRNIGAIVEVNCETDFVARNDQFQAFVQSVTQACCQHAADLATNNNGLSKLDFDGAYLKQITIDAGDGARTLSDHLALIIGKVGENASLRRATCFKVGGAVQLASFAHPSQTTEATDDGKNVVLLGKFGALVALKTGGGAATPVDAELQKNLCQHIVGMNPAKVGAADVDKPAEEKDDERCLIWQEYLLEPSLQVHEVLAENGLEVVEFQRFECGEPLASDAEPAQQQAQQA